MQLLNKITKGDSEETEKVLEALASSRLTIDERNLLVHLSNVTRRDSPCGYFGRFLGEDSVSKPRCLAPEQEKVDPDRVKVCPFYKSDLESRCNYHYNKNL